MINYIINCKDEKRVQKMFSELKAEISALNKRIDDNDQLTSGIHELATNVATMSLEIKMLTEKFDSSITRIEGYLWSDTATSKPVYNSKQDVSANGMLSKCTEKGKIATMPDIPGVLVFMNGHVGVYVGNGEVIEAQGHENGVIKTKLKNRPWKDWGKCPWITYQDEKQKFSLKVKPGTWNVRTGAGTGCGIVCIVKGGDAYPASKVTNGWYYIDSLNGWISPKAVDLM